MGSCARRCRWNKFDFVVVLFSLADLYATVLNASFLRILRIARVSRVVRLTRGLKSMQSMLGTLLASLSAFWSVGAMLCLVFFMYAYVGVQMFGRIKLRHPREADEGINDHVNFMSFENAIYLLLQVATGESWVRFPALERSRSRTKS